MALPPTNPPGLVRDAEDLNKVVNSDGTTNRAGDSLPSLKSILGVVEARRDSAVLAIDSAQSQTESASTSAIQSIQQAEADTQGALDDAVNRIITEGEQAAASTGWFIVGDFADGFEFTARNQVGRDVVGELWSYNGDALPFEVTAGTTPSEPAYTNRGDAALRSALAAEGGASLVRGTVFTVDSLIDLLNAPQRGGQQVSVAGFYPGSNVGGGIFERVSDADLTQNNGGAIFSIAALQAWYDAAITEGGATPDSLHENLSTLQAAGVGTGDVFVRITDRPFTPVDFGARGVGDDTIPCQKYLDYILSSTENEFNIGMGRPTALFKGSPSGYFNTTDTLQASPFIDVEMTDTIRYDGPNDRPAFVHGEPGESSVGRKGRYRVGRANIVWPQSPMPRGEEVDIGLVLYNMNTAQLHIDYVNGFEIGLLTMGDGRAFSYSTTMYGRLDNNKVQHWLSSGNGGWINENAWIGGQIRRTASAVNQRTCQGIRSLRKNGQSNHNNNKWYATSFEQLGFGADGDAPVVDAENMSQCAFLDYRDESNGPIFVKLGPGAFENEFLPGYSGTPNYRTRIDDSESPFPTTVTRYSARQKFIDYMNLPVWDSGDIRQRSCYVNGNRVNVAGMQHGSISNSAPTFDGKSIGLATIDNDGLSTQGAGAIGLFLEIVDTLPPRSAEILVKLTTKLPGGARPYLVCYDDDFNQIDVNNNSVIKGRSGSQTGFSDFLGGSRSYSYNDEGYYYFKTTPSVRYVGIFLQIRGILQRVQIMTQQSTAMVRPFIRYREPIPGANIGTSPPTQGNSEQGRIIWNENPEADSPLGWRCIESGDPGTWEAI